MEKTIYDLELHERLKIPSGVFEIYRVPGGWIYVYIDLPDQPTFVPFSNEFLKTQTEK